MFGPDAPFSWQLCPQFILGIIVLSAAYSALIIRARWLPRELEPSAPALGTNVIPVGGAEPVPKLGSGYGGAPSGDPSGAGPDAELGTQSEIRSGAEPGASAEVGLVSKSEFEVVLSSALWTLLIWLGTVVSAVETEMGNKVYPAAQTDYGFSVVMHYCIGYACFMGFVQPGHSLLFFLIPLINLISGFRSADAVAVYFPYGLVR